MMFMELINLVIIALLGEAIWETLKLIWDKGKFSWDRIGALVVGLIVAIGTGFDIFTLSGIPISIPYVGLILTGILISRGANFVHDLLSKLQSPAAQQLLPLITSTNGKVDIPSTSNNTSAEKIIDNLQTKGNGLPPAAQT